MLVPERLRLPFRRTKTSAAAFMLTRSPRKRSFASSIRSQSAALTLGTRDRIQRLRSGERLRLKYAASRDTVLALSPYFQIFHEPTLHLRHTVPSPWTDLRIHPWNFPFPPRRTGGFLQGAPPDGRQDGDVAGGTGKSTSSRAERGYEWIRSSRRGETSGSPCGNG